MCGILLCILNEFLLSHLLFIIFHELPLIGPDIPSVAVHSTEDKQSECCLCTAHEEARLTVLDSLVTKCVIPRFKSSLFLYLTAEVFDVETNEKVNITYNSMQMPKVQYETITIDDYSMCLC